VYSTAKWCNYCTCGMAYEKLSRLDLLSAEEREKLNWIENCALDFVSTVSARGRD
jgi:hypothetical protein